MPPALHPQQSVCCNPEPAGAEGSCARLFFATCTPHQTAVQHSSVVVHGHKAAWPLRGTNLQQLLLGPLNAADMLGDRAGSSATPLLSASFSDLSGCHVSDVHPEAPKGILTVSPGGSGGAASWDTSYSRRAVASDATQSLFGDRGDGGNCFGAPHRNPERCSAQTLNPLLSTHLVLQLPGLQPPAPLSADVALKLDHWIRVGTTIY